jgi:hypothetical protein
MLKVPIQRVVDHSNVKTATRIDGLNHFFSLILTLKRRIREYRIVEMGDYQRFLLHQCQQILSHVTPSKDGGKLRQLLDQLIAYQLAVRKHPLASLPSVSSNQFDVSTKPLSLELAAEIDYRIELAASYQMTNPQRICQLLLAGLQIDQPPQFNLLHVTYLTTIHQKPLIGSVKLATELGISPRTLNQEKNYLFAHYGIHVASMLDPHQFKLAHVGVHFRTKSLKMSQQLENRFLHELQINRTLPFLQGYVFDLNQQDGFLASFIPNQVQAKKQFHQLIQEWDDLFFEYSSTHYIWGYYENMNFTSYNHISNEWEVTADLRTEGTRQFIEKHGFQFPPPRGFTYSQKTLSFTPADWILALSICEGLLDRKDRQMLLNRFGLPMAEKTVWTHENKLKKTQSYFPYIAVSRLFFDEIICAIIKCEASTIEFLHQFITQFALSRLFLTVDGIILFIGVPSWGSSLTNQLTHTLLDMPGLSDVVILRFKRDLPHLPAIHTHRLWNSKTRQWTSPESSNMPKA